MPATHTTPAGSDVPAVSLLGPGPWLAYEPALRAFEARAAMIRCEGPWPESKAESDPMPPGLSVDKAGMATIRIMNAIQRYSDGFAGFLAMIMGSSCTDRLMACAGRCMADASIKCVLLDVDSPGGDGNGIGELAAQIAALVAAKPTVAYVGGMGASAAYWLASPCYLVAAPTAMLGSIGVKCNVDDDSEQLKARGIKRTTIVATQSPRKAPDVNTPAGKAQFQELVDAMADQFLEAVATNRKTSVQRVQEDFGQGDLLSATEALKVGMIDAVGYRDTALAKLAAMMQPQPTSTGLPPAYAVAKPITMARAHARPL